MRKVSHDAERLAYISPLSAFDRVTISHEVRHGGRTGVGYDTYPVRLVGPAAVLPVDTPVSTTAAARVAEEVATFLGLKFEGESIVR